MSDLRDKIARAVRAEYDKLPASRYPHEGKVADAVLDAITSDLDTIRADVFDAGVMVGRKREHHRNMTREQAELAFPNPYRKADQ